MLRFGLAVSVLLIVLGCEGSNTHYRSTLDQQMFGPASVRIHPTFTQVRDLTSGGKPDGIEATLEVQDQFGEPTRSTGRTMFELYTYRRDSPDVRGGRFDGPWIAFLNTKADQQEHWNPALRAYTFQLHSPKISPDEYYVLTVQCDLNNSSSTTRPGTAPASSQAGRLFDQLILEPKNEEKAHGPKYHAPTGTPGR
jgi:hypothetical protein